MNAEVRAGFAETFARYFPGAELPVAFFYADAPPPGMHAEPKSRGWRCVISDLGRARKGESLCLDEPALGCGKRFCGFPAPRRPDFEHFLSSGIPGRMQGERYKKDPATVREWMKQMPEWRAPARCLVVKRWDALAGEDEPEAAIFFARPDVLSGLFTLANFEEADSFAVIAPFASGCAAVIQYPFLENRRAAPRCVLGMFDVSARPCVGAGELTFAVPMRKLERMIGQIGESFVITPSWEKVMRRLRAVAGD
jgi:hypothetical protein